jgi:agmatinase
MDVVEVSPPYDHADVTAFLANRVVLEMLSGIAYRRRGGRWNDIPPTLLGGRRT